jgi:hypothetical protein
MPVKIKRRPTKIILRVREIKEQPELNTDTYWDKIKGGADLCFVCDKKFTPSQRRTFIGRHKHTGIILMRHVHCESGSANWIEKFGGRVAFDNTPSPVRNLTLRVRKDIEEEPQSVIIRRREK